jgi:hypothetical protein
MISQRVGSRQIQVARSFDGQDARSELRQLLTGNWLKFIRSHFNRRMLIDQLQRQDESQTALLPHQSAFDTLHRAAFDPDLFANDKLTVRLNAMSAEVRAEKLDLRSRNGNWSAAIADDSQNAGDPKNRGSLRGIDPSKDIRGKEGTADLDPLPVLPNTHTLTRREVGLEPACV